jgi:hypothetical protein
MDERRACRQVPNDDMDRDTRLTVLQTFPTTVTSTTLLDQSRAGVRCASRRGKHGG